MVLYRVFSELKYMVNKQNDGVKKERKERGKIDVGSIKIRHKITKNYIIIGTRDQDSIEVKNMVYNETLYLLNLRLVDNCSIIYRTDLHSIYHFPELCYGTLLMNLSNPFIYYTSLLYYRYDFINLLTVTSSISQTDQTFK